MSSTIDKGNVVEFPRAVGVPKGELHAFVGNAVLDYMRLQGETLINGKDGAWLYSRGVWELRTDIDAWLGMRVEKVCEGLGITNTNKLTGEVRNRILRSPELWREGKMPWDQHGKIPTRSGLIDPKTGELEPARPGSLLYVARRGRLPARREVSVVGEDDRRYVRRPR
ncbi:hypothetical protein ACVWZK_007180 [Bradyrhizobium sp. GM0.4]